MPRVNTLFSKSLLSRRRNNVTKTNLIRHYDPGNPLSYPGTGLTLNDISGNNRHAALNDPMEHNAFRGFFQWASGDYIDIPNVTSAEIATGFSYFIWYYPLQDGGTRTFFESSPFIMSTKFNTDNTFYIIARLSVLSGTTKKDISSSTTISLPKSKWLHIGIVFDNVSLQIYIDKNLVASTPKTFVPGTAAATGTNVRFGRTTWFNQIYYITGKVAAMRMYSYGTPPAAITAIYNEDKSRYFGSGLPGTRVSSGLVFSTQARLTTDTAGSTTGTIFGTVGFNAAMGGYSSFGDYPSPIPKTFTDLVRYTNTATLQNLTSISIAAWVNFPDDLGSTIVEKNVLGLDPMRGANVLSTGFSLYRIGGTNTGFYFAYGEGTTSNPLIRTKTITLPNQWYYVVVTLAPGGSGAKIYVNGEEEADAYYTARSAASPVVLGNTVAMNIGRARNRSIPLTGGGPGRSINIADLAIYNRVLTDNEVWENFTADSARFGL